MKKEYPMYPIHTDMIDLMCNNTGPHIRERLRCAFAILMLIFTCPADRPARAIGRTLVRLVTGVWL